MRIFTKTGLSIIAWLIALLVPACVIFFEPDPARDTPIIADSGKLGDQNFVDVNLDTFKVLLAKTYTKDLKVEKESGKLHVAILNNGAMIHDFINNNKNLETANYPGFSVKIDEKNKTLDAFFRLSTENGRTYVTLPTDILFKITEKAYNQ